MKQRPEPAKLTLKARCPRCGQGRLFDGWLTLAGRCDRCKLNYRPLDPGDGPAVFVIFLVGIVVVLMAMIVEIAFAPPLWVHAAIWIPVIVTDSLIGLRFIKILMVGQHYRKRAAEGRIEDRR